MGSSPQNSVVAQEVIEIPVGSNTPIETGDQEMIFQPILSMIKTKITTGSHQVIQQKRLEDSEDMQINLDIRARESKSVVLQQCDDRSSVEYSPVACLIKSDISDIDE